MINVVPIGTRLLVKRMKEDQTEGGIILPETGKDHALIGEVIAVGECVCGTINIGDMVLFGRYSGQGIERNLPLHSSMSKEFEDVYLMVDEDIIAIVCQDEDLAEVKTRIHNVANEG